jgi:uncharacterized protein
MTQRQGDWIQTYMGVQFWPLDARADDVDIRDIAHALANICRFTGHVRRFYSVAQHSVIVSAQVPPGLMRAALLHDAAEAYLGDISRPLKRCLWAATKAGVEPVSHLDLKRAKHAEKDLLRVIFDAFGVEWPDDWTEIDRADMLLLATEARDLMGELHPCWRYKQANGYPVLPGRISPQNPLEAEKSFLERWHELAGG